MTAAQFGATAIALLALVVVAAGTCLSRFRRLQTALGISRRELGYALGRLAWHQALYRILTQDAACAVAVLDSAGQPVPLGCGGGQESLDAAYLLTSPAAAAVNPDDLEALQAALTACSPARPTGEALVRAQQPDGHTAWVRLRCRHVPEDGSTVALLHDVTEQVMRDERLAGAVGRLASHDPLTGLRNRAGFLAEIDHRLAAGSPMALLLVNLDAFRDLNDAHGHTNGDAILCTIGERLATLVEPPATLARLNADEFAVLLPEADSDVMVAATARDILRAIGLPLQIGGDSLEITATVGMAVGPRDGRATSALLRSADIALAYGKTAGGACYRFYEAHMGAALAAETALQDELRTAIAEGAIEPYFQPVVRLRERAVSGFEVLARWPHPQKGVLAPERFLPMADQLRLSADLFAGLLERACMEARGWPAGIGLAFNLSPAELRSPALADTVNAILDRTGFPPTRLCVEVTELALLHDPEAVRAALLQLRALGLSASLDDFGTGPSSLSHLREMPFDTVKVDVSLMRALHTEAGSRHVAAIAGLCRTLKLEMIAEGVEDQATLVRLREMGFTHAQGYLLGRPVPAAEAARLLVPGGWHVLAAE